MTAPATGRRIAVQGTVQGVGFRPWVYHLAKELRVVGSVCNGPEGVTIDAFGSEPVLDALLLRLKTDLPRAARIDALVWSPLSEAAPSDFSIVVSGSTGHARASIPADLALCDDCRAEINDSTARRFQYPFTNCTHCGPRFTIATSVPYDRSRTTMSGFPLCADCLREYNAADDRRFHAQPIACPVCGPKLSWLDERGVAVDGNELQTAAQKLVSGSIVALRGLGGFHLACDALNDSVVRALRTRKHRDEKPLAVMVADVEMARRYADLELAALDLLTSPARPIVLVPMKAGLAPAIAPGFRQVGLFLPYTPLHELLLAAVRRPLVMTSGNRSDEPMAVETDDAVERLRGIADGFLSHDRPIATRTDDSVARIVDGAPMLLRRARGYVPESLPSPIALTQPVLAVGGQLKNTCCIASGTRLTLGPHVGDLENLSTFESFKAAVARLEQFLEVKPRVVAHDLHPAYESTRYALEREGVRCIGVQHHHAHVAAVMAEHQLQGSVLGVAFDGTGFGADGASWGGEFLEARYDGFERLATLRPMRLAGGERAIREPWRLALAALDDAFNGAAPFERLRLFERLAPRDRDNVKRMLETKTNVVSAHGMGRVFDAAAALILERPNSTYEAQLATALEQFAEGEGSPYPFEFDRSTTPWQVDFRPMWRALVEDVAGGKPAATVSANFHATLGAAAARLVREADALRQAQGERSVVLAGGCFANARLTHEVTKRLDGFSVYLPRLVPPGDGGLALGQAVVAAAQLEQEGAL